MLGKVPVYSKVIKYMALKANISKTKKCHSERLLRELGHCEYSTTPDFNSAAACKKSFLTIFEDFLRYVAAKR